MYRILLSLCSLFLLACSSEEQAFEEAESDSTQTVSEPTVKTSTANANQPALRLLNEVIVPLPEQRIVTSTSRDTEFDEYLFTPLSEDEQQALAVDQVFDGEVHRYQKLPKPDVYAAGKLADVQGGFLVLFCSVVNVDLHIYRLHAAAYDAEGQLTEQVFIGQMDFMTPGLAARKYWLIFSKDTIEFARGQTQQRRIVSPCVVVRARKSGLLKTEQTCSRNR